MTGIQNTYKELLQVRMDKRLEWIIYSKNAKGIFNKHVQKRPTLSVIMEMQIKATRRKHPIVTKRAERKKLTMLSFGKDVLHLSTLDCW